MLSASDVTLEARQLVMLAAEPAQIGERTTAQIRRAATRLGLSYGQCKGYWYAERRCVAGHEIENLRLLVREIQDRRNERRALLDDMGRKINAVVRRKHGASS